jgi:hypothetical protein
MKIRNNNGSGGAGEGGAEGQRWPVRRADNHTTFMCRMSSNLGASTTWNPQGLSRPVMGLLYLYLTYDYTNILI